MMLARLSRVVCAKLVKSINLPEDIRLRLIVNEISHSECMFQTGYMFGKGIYFADMVSKSANYCFTSPGNDVGLLLLCEVALGDM